MPAVQDMSVMCISFSQNGFHARPGFVSTADGPVVLLLVIVLLPPQPIIRGPSLCASGQAGVDDPG